MELDMGESTTASEGSSTTTELSNLSLDDSATDFQDAATDVGDLSDRPIRSFQILFQKNYLGSLLLQVIRTNWFVSNKKAPSCAFIFNGYVLTRN